MKLYELGEEFAALDTMFEEVEGEVTPELQALLDELLAKLADKSDGIAKVLRTMQAREAAAKLEAEMLTGIAKVAANARTRLAQYVVMYMQKMNRDRIQGDVFRLRIQANGSAPAVKVLVDAALLPAKYRTTELTLTGEQWDQLGEIIHRHGGPALPAASWTADTAGLKAALAEGVPGIEALVEQPPKGVHLRVE